MALAVLTIACFLSYSTSRYFPMEAFDFGKKQPKVVLAISVAIAFVALFLFSADYDFATALIIWLAAYMAILSSIVVSLKLNVKSVWLWGAFSLLAIVIDLV
ncbi:MAG: hypothetical protein AAF927_20005 [Bacteroidota bacterium]